MYTGTYMNTRENKLYVAERVNGQRIITSYPLILEYYVPDSNGYYMGYDGKRVRKITCKTFNEFRAHQAKCREEKIPTYELNFNLTNKVLYQHYNQAETPKLNTSFMDIEVDRKGFEYLTVNQLVEKACCPINAISIYNSWQNTLFTLMLCPDTLDFDEAQKICNKFDNTFLFKDEKQLLKGIIALLADAECATGWNSRFFDTPYIVRRIINMLGEEEAKQLCLFGQSPKLREKENKFGALGITYDIIGKWFVDYMELYIKHQRGQKESYKLDAIAELELGERKVEHDESLDDMYRQRYEDFIKYNRQDTMLVKKFEDKLKYIETHNMQAHETCCSMEDTLGTVAYIDQCFINEAHNKGLVVNDRDEDKNWRYQDIVPPGAAVPTPVTGLCKYVMSLDMHALYPSSCRSLNMSPETIVAQVRIDKTQDFLWKRIKDNDWYKNKAKKIPDWGAAWGHVWGSIEFQEIMKQSDTMLTLDYESGESVQATAKEIYDAVFNDNSNLCISALGTIFRTDVEGLIPHVFTKWDKERSIFKNKKAYYEDLYSGVKIEDEDLLKQLSE